jgi:hypothetical protein
VIHLGAARASRVLLAVAITAWLIGLMTEMPARF